MGPTPSWPEVDRGVLALIETSLEVDLDQNVVS